MGSGKVEAIEIHDLVPRRHEIMDKCLLCIVTCVNFRQSAKLGVRPEDEIDMGALWGSFISSTLDSSLVFERMSKVTPTGMEGFSTLLE
jgi:hypothetical protein